MAFNMTEWYDSYNVHKMGGAESGPLPEKYVTGMECV